jgi:hypothetical protein
MSARVQRQAAITALVIGIGLAVAPAIFQMFDRAPKGGDMIDEFEPYMTSAKIDTFAGYLDLIDAANSETIALRDEMVAQGSISAEEYDTTYAGASALNGQWATIDEDMGDLIARMDRNLDNYEAVAALPPFPLFPWFFFLPGLMIAAIATVLLWRLRSRNSHRGLVWVLVCFGVALVAAPAVFQMFTRAPKGGEMIDDFRPMMTIDRVRNVQGYFITLGSAEGQLRVGVLPAFTESGGDLGDYPEVTEFSAQWPTIVQDFNPMIATMRDNIENFEAVAALPPFPLFPWFFVAPGVIVAGMAAVALRRSPSPDSTPTQTGGNPS